MYLLVVKPISFPFKRNKLLFFFVRKINYFALFANKSWGWATRNPLVFYILHEAYWEWLNSLLRELRLHFVPWQIYTQVTEMLNSKWHICCATQLPPLMQQLCLLNKVSMTMSDSVRVVLSIRIRLKEEILPTVKRLLNSIANSPLKCKINDLPLWRSPNPAPHEWNIFKLFNESDLRLKYWRRENASYARWQRSQASIIKLL